MPCQFPCTQKQRNRKKCSLGEGRHKTLAPVQNPLRWRQKIGFLLVWRKGPWADLHLQQNPFMSLACCADIRIARRASYSWDCAGCIIFWLCLFCGWAFFGCFSVWLQLFNGLRCWYCWAFSSSYYFLFSQKLFILPEVSCRIAGWAHRASTLGVASKTRCVPLFARCLLRGVLHPVWTGPKKKSLGSRGFWYFSSDSRTSGENNGPVWEHKSNTSVIGWLFCRLQASKFLTAVWRLSAA